MSCCNSSPNECLLGRSLRCFFLLYFLRSVRPSSLKNFLTDESGKITKKDALGISAGAALLAGLEDVAAGHSSGSTHLSQ